MLLRTDSSIPPRGRTHLPPRHLQQQSQEALQGLAIPRCAPHQGGHVLRQRLEELEAGLEKPEGQGPQGWLSVPFTTEKAAIPQGWPFKVALCVTSLLDIAASAWPFLAGTDPSHSPKFSSYLDDQVVPRAAGCRLALQYPAQGGGQALQQRGQVLPPVLSAQAALLHEHADCGQGDSISSQNCTCSQPCSWLSPRAALLVSGVRRGLGCRECFGLSGFQLSQVGGQSCWVLLGPLQRSHGSG